MRGRFISVLLRGFHVYAASGNLERIIATAIDLSVVKEAEAKAKQLQDELVHVSSVNAMGAMASTLAQELNQPLTAISNYLGGCEKIGRAHVCTPVTNAHHVCRPQPVTKTTYHTPNTYT